MDMRYIYDITRRANPINGSESSTKNNDTFQGIQTGPGLKNGESLPK